MNLLLWGITFGTIGKLILGIAVLRVHIHILKEHKIDNIVLKSLKREQYVTFIGLGFILVGYLMEIFFYSSATTFLTCEGLECASALQAVFQ